MTSPLPPQPQRVSAAAAWRESDLARALHDTDRDVIRATEAARSLVLDQFSAASARDLFNACARLGGLLAAGGCSPSLAAATIDGAAKALQAASVEMDPARIDPARAACLEGYVGELRDQGRRAAAAQWAYPACVVPLPNDEAAIACGHPLDDREALTAWAAAVATRLVRAKVRRVILSGTPEARAEIESAVTLVGIAVVAAPTKKWLPWL